MTETQRIGIGDDFGTPEEAEAFVMGKVREALDGATITGYTSGRCTAEGEPADDGDHSQFRVDFEKDGEPGSISIMCDSPDALDRLEV